MLLLLWLLQEVNDNEVLSSDWANLIFGNSFPLSNFRQKFKILRFLVLQMAVVHVIIFLTLNLISVESPETTVENIMIFFVPFIAVTIILGVWAFQITIRMIVPYYVNLKLLRKFISFQLVLIFCKLQPVLLSYIFKQIIDNCQKPFSTVVMIRSKFTWKHRKASRINRLISTQQSRRFSFNWKCFCYHFGRNLSTEVNHASYFQLV